jgi:hypothetical protein
LIFRKEEEKMSLELQELVLERDGCPLHYWVGGPDGAPLEIFTHGANLDNPEFFHKNLLDFLQLQAKKRR